MDLGRRIKAWREHLGLSQKELAEEIGVVPATVSMWESDDYSHAPHRKHREKLLEVFGVTELRFYGRLPKPKKQPARKPTA